MPSAQRCPAADFVLCSDGAPLAVVARHVVQLECIRHRLQRACNLLSVSQAFHAAVLTGCNALLPVTFAAANLEDVQAIASWLRKYGKLAQSLDLNWQGSRSGLSAACGLPAAEQAAADAALAACVGGSSIAGGWSAAAEALQTAASRADNCTSSAAACNRRKDAGGVGAGGPSLRSRTPHGHPEPAVILLTHCPS